MISSSHFRCQMLLTFDLCTVHEYDMHHEMLTQRALFCHRANTKRGTLSQHFVTHVVPPLGSQFRDLCGEGGRSQSTSHALLVRLWGVDNKTHFPCIVGQALGGGGGVDNKTHFPCIVGQALGGGGGGR